MSSPNSTVYHESKYQHGKWKDGAWYCQHETKAAERTAMKSRSLAYVGLKFWICVSHPSCQFYLWEDHVVDALKYHKASEEDIMKMTPRKRKRDRNITEYFPITPKTRRTRDAEADSSEDDIYELSDREPGRNSRHRDSSPTPMPRRSNAPSRSLGPPSPPSSWEDAAIQVEQDVVLPEPPPPPPPSNARPYSALTTIFSGAQAIPSSTATLRASVAQEAARHRPNTPPPTARAPGPNAAALAPSPAFEPRTPTSNNRRRTTVMQDQMPPPANPPTPGSGRRKLSLQELDTYNVVVKALAGANVKLSVKGQNALRDIIKEEDFWIGS